MPNKGHSGASLGGNLEYSNRRKKAYARKRKREDDYNKSRNGPVVITYKDNNDTGA